MERSRTKSLAKKASTADAIDVAAGRHEIDQFRGPGFGEMSGIAVQSRPGWLAPLAYSMTSSIGSPSGTCFMLTEFMQ